MFLAPPLHFSINPALPIRPPQILQGKAATRDGSLPASNGRCGANHLCLPPDTPLHHRLALTAA